VLAFQFAPIHLTVMALKFSVLRNVRQSLGSIGGGEIVTLSLPKSKGIEQSTQCTRHRFMKIFNPCRQLDHRIGELSSFTIQLGLEIWKANYKPEVQKDC